MLIPMQNICAESRMNFLNESLSEKQGNCLRLQPFIFSIFIIKRNGDISILSTPKLLVVLSNAFLISLKIT